MAKRLLHAAIHAWDSPFQVGSHAIARQFAAAGWEVAYVSAPISPLHRWLGQSNDLALRRAVHAAGGCRSEDGRLWHYVPYTLLPPANAPLLRTSWLLNNWQRFSWPDVLDRIAAAGFGQVDLLLLDSVYQPFWLDSLSYGRSIYRAADLASGFSGAGRGIARSEAAIVRRVDRVMVTAASLEPVMRGLGARDVALLPNGVDYARLVKPMPRPADYAGMHGRIAVYAGDFGPWFDADLVAALARHWPTMDIVLIGPRDRLVKRLPALPNLHLLGTRSRDELPAYLQHASVGLIPFDAVRQPALVEHIHPLKLYEYLACGLPVVATHWSTLSALDSPATLCRDAASFIQSAGTAGPHPQQVERGRDFALAADWSRRLLPLLRYAEEGASS